MAEVSIEADEWYPVYSFKRVVEGGYYSQYGTRIEVNGNTLKRWSRVMEEFANLQRELRTLSNDRY